MNNDPQILEKSKQENPQTASILKPSVFDDVHVKQLSQGTSAVALTLPAHWPQNPDAWFVKVEAQLRAANITKEETGFYGVLAVLPESAAVKVREISFKPKFESGDYEKLKQKLVSSSQSTVLERIEKL